jgi:predicted nucleotidyltransferase
VKNLNSIKNPDILNILNEVKERLINFFGEKVNQVILYGSYARIEQNEDSDIDIMILFNDSLEQIKKHRYQIARIMADLSLKHGKLISISEENFEHYIEYMEILPFYKNIFDDGVEIYGRKIN